jgi:hypothetical protein
MEDKNSDNKNLKNPIAVNKKIAIAIISAATLVIILIAIVVISRKL